MFTFHVASERRTAVSLALVCALASCLGCPGGAATEITAPSVIAFDEIDHVYTTENVPPPVRSSATPARWRRRPSPRQHRIRAAASSER